MARSRWSMSSMRCLPGFSRDFDTAHTFLETLYASSRLVLPLKHVVVIGY
jgi:hypothetical protein